MDAGESMKLTEAVMVVVAAAILASLLTAGMWLTIHRFDECRAHGFTTLYCIGQ